MQRQHGQEEAPQSGIKRSSLCIHVTKGKKSTSLFLSFSVSFTQPNQASLYPKKALFWISLMLSCTAHSVAIFLKIQHKNIRQTSALMDVSNLHKPFTVCKAPMHIWNVWFFFSFFLFTFWKKLGMAKKSMGKCVIYFNLPSVDVQHRDSKEYPSFDFLYIFFLCYKSSPKYIYFLLRTFLICSNSTHQKLDTVPSINGTGVFHHFSS